MYMMCVISVFVCVGGSRATQYGLLGRVPCSFFVQVYHQGLHASWWQRGVDND